MIIVKLMGGLGNQMFQYAFGRSLAIKLNTELKLDLSFLLDRSPKENFTYRNFELPIFNIRSTIANESEIEGFKINNRFHKIINYIFLHTPNTLSNCYLREPYFHFFNHALKAPVNTYVDGYWQSEKYFKMVEDEIRKDFIFSSQLSAQTILLANEICKQNSVSIHVRRSDYVSNTHINSYHGTCSEEYYFNAIKLIKEQIQNPIFYVFSDEPEWFKQNIKTDVSIVFVEHNKGEKSFEDMYLMSICKHNIIANSSFSWWGAWLNTNNTKQVIAPLNWFQNESKNTKDLIPANWIKL